MNCVSVLGLPVSGRRGVATVPILRPPSPLLMEWRIPCANVTNLVWIVNPCVDGAVPL